MKINNCGKFYQYSIYGRQVKNFKIMYTNSAWNTNSLFFFEGQGGGGGGEEVEPLLPTILQQYCPILQKFSPEVVFQQRKLMFE